MPAISHVNVLDSEHAKLVGLGTHPIIALRPLHDHVLLLATVAKHQLTSRLVAVPTIRGRGALEPGNHLA